jgi:SNF2 family DNA or RNA helicase
MKYVLPRLQITPRVPRKDITLSVRCNIGKIKNDINLENLEKEHYILQNQVLVDFFKGKDFIPLSDFYSKSIQEDFDLFGGFYTVTIDNIDYDVRLYFYKFKHPELLSSSFISKYELIFQQAYLIKDNILDMDYHEYRMTMFKTDLCAPKYMDTNYVQHPLVQTPLRNYQKFNIRRMLDIHSTGVPVKITNNLIMDFPNDLYYDFTAKKFMNYDDIPVTIIHSGILSDEPGIGKTLQFIAFVIHLINNSFLNDDDKILILVPDDLKTHWIMQFDKHAISLDTIPITLMGFNEFRKVDLYKKADVEFIKRHKMIGIDEMHVLYTSKTDIFEKILRLNFPYRWGITGTPILTHSCLFNIIKFLTGMNFHNERIANIPSVQDQIIKLFLKNTIKNTLDETKLPPVVYHNVQTHLDIVYQTMYESESKSLGSVKSLQKLIGSLDLLANRDITNKMTPKELKQSMINRYKTIFDNAVSELEQLVTQLKNIHECKEKFTAPEYINRVSHFEQLIKKKDSEVHRHRGVYEFIVKSINDINKIVNSNGEETDVDENCPICMNYHTPPISYIKTCGHYFCKECFDAFMGMTKLSHSRMSCPFCRSAYSNNDIVVVTDVCDITCSSKCQALLDIIGKSKDDRFIVFTQFPEMIDNLISIFTRHNINSIKFQDFNSVGNKDDYSVIILSSIDNAAGHDLSFINNVIIFEPFEDVMYCKNIEEQLIGRVYRIGQTKSEVNVYRLITMGTIDEQIYSKFLQ